MGGNLFFADVFQRQIDYVFFVNSIAFFFLAAVCVSLRNYRNSRLAWLWLAGFGLFHGVNEWLGLITLVFAEHPRYSWLHQGMITLSFVLLVEFGRISRCQLGCRSFSRWYSLGLLMVALLMVALATEKQLDVFRYLLALSGGVVVAQTLRMAARRLDYGGGRLATAALCMALYALIAGLAETPASFFPGRPTGNLAGLPVQLITAMVVVVAAGCIWSAFSYEHWRNHFSGQEGQGTSPGRRDLVRGILLVMILVLGWLAAEYVDKDTEEELRENVTNLTQAAAAALHGEDIAQLSLGRVREESSQYQQIKHQMIKIKASYPAVLWAYVMVRQDEKVFFLVDSIQSNEPGYAPLNMIYEKPPPELEQVFRTGHGVAVGPYSDEWGRFVSGFAPIRDHFTAELVGVFAVDIEARNWQKIIAKHRMAPISVTGLIWLLFIGAFLARQRLLESKQRIEASEERLALAMQGANDGLWDWNLLTGGIYFSPQWQRMLGYGEEELPHRMEVLHDLLHPDDKARALTAIDACRNGESEKLEIEIRLQHKQGYYVDILSRAFAVRRDGHGKAVRLVGTHVDISERNQVARELLTAKEKAESATRTKSAFLANMSHEIRTPMNAILGFAQLLLREPDLTPAQRQSLTTINRSGEHLLALINDILEMSKIEAGQLHSNPEEFDLPQFIRDLDVMFRLRATEKGLLFHVETDAKLPCYVLADKQKLRQIFFNLISNALKFTQAGAITIRVSGVTNEKGELRLLGEVTDTGPGIATEELAQLFRPFSQTEAGARVGGGTGLGLAISREFARLLGGDIQVDSQVGAGSRFWLDVPLPVGRREECHLPVVPQRVMGIKDPADWRILIVDDTEENRQLLAALLGGVGFATRTAADGRQALNAVGEWQPHLIFMDIRMPVMNGFEATRAIRALPGGARLPVIGVSASVLPEEEQQALASGVDRYIRKPFPEEEIFAAIADFLPVEYVYYTGDVTETAETAVAAPATAAIPPELIAALRDAVLKAQFDQMMTLLDQLAVMSPQAAVQLRQLVERYEYDKLLDLLAVDK